MKSAAALHTLCLLVALLPLAAIRRPPPPAHHQPGFPGWPESFDGRPLRPAPLPVRDAAYARAFGGHTGQFTDGERQYLIRWTPLRTRALHPASHCFRGAGYRIQPAPLETDARRRRWSCFHASRAGRRLKVCEAILGAAGDSHSDVSAWYWAASTGASRGPWWAFTRVEPHAAPPSAPARIARLR